MIRKTIIAAVLAASFASVAMPAAAVVYVRVAPPESRVEHVPPPRHGKVWVAGHYEYRNHRYQWVKGAWVKERRGYTYHQPKWEERDGRWAYEHRGWQRGDSDHDGVRNGQDRAPNNPNRS
jgi:hypothetical protein